MGSPEVLDFDQLLAPIPGDLPTGKDAREDLNDAQDDAVRREAEKQIAVCEEILRITGS